MTSMFGGGPDTSKQRAQLQKQETEARKRELNLAKEIAARRKAASAQSKTIFKAVEGNANTIAKKTKLGG